jgi:pimeloyl-ACP methyl ester carboxylesterase
MAYQLKEENAVIESNVKLSGTVTIPNGTESVYPAVLLLPGSGGSDRDGNHDRLQMRIYKDLADFLTGLGFVTLRYDKRGTHKSEGDAYTRGLHDLVLDATACLRFLKHHPNVDPNRTIIIGHSEGAQISPAVFLQEKAAGMVLLCGGAMGMQKITNWQRQQALDAIDQLGGFKGWLFRTMKATEKAKKTNEKFDQRILNGNETVIRVMGKKFPAKWLREFYQYDIVNDLREVTCPVLVIGGEKDIQVPLEASENVISIVPGETELHIIKNMTHILKCWDGDMDAANTIKIYKQLTNVSLADDLKSCLRTWTNKYFFADSVKDEHTIDLNT